MANEAILDIETEIPIMMNVADATAIPKGSVLKLNDLMVVTISAADNDVFGGIAAEEKIANDGKTKIAAYMGGMFVLTDSGAGITLGANVTIDGVNVVKTFTAGDSEDGTVVGKCMETVGAGDTFKCWVGRV